MKTRSFFLSFVHLFLFAGGLMLLIDCNNGRRDDSVNNANAQNAKKDSAVTPRSTAMDDAKFLVKAADGGMLEVQLGQLAAKRAVNRRVKNFGSMMVQDHTKANNDLEMLATSKNVTIPQTLSDDSQKKFNKLNAVTGTDFDKAYMDMMVDDHNDDVSDFTKEAKESTDNDVQSFANKTLPVLQIHLDSARAIQSVVKKETSRK
jgi:putative membrane protein